LRDAAHWDENRGCPKGSRKNLFDPHQHLQAASDRKDLSFVGLHRR
jgi:hypothetical protein